MNKAAFFKLSYGLYIVTAGADGRFNGQIANTAFQVTSEPCTVAISINKLNYTHEHIRTGRRFAVSILAETAPMTLIGQFGFKSGRDIDKFGGIKVRIGATGIPIVAEHVTAYFEAKVVNEFDCGTHTLFLGEIVEADVLDGAAEPMTYAYYHQVKGGKSPKNAPTYQKEEAAAPSAPAEAARWTCSICGYVYDPAAGDPEAKIPAGTAFEDLPAAWTCPICGAEKDKFAKEK